MELEIKEILKTSYFTKSIYKILRLMYQRYCRFRYNVRMQNQGLNTLCKIQMMLEQTNCDFFFDMGTLLGLIREGKLIKNDGDIDVGVILKKNDDISKIQGVFGENGYKLKRKYIVKGVGETLNSYYINGLEVDICFYTEAEGKYIGYLFYDPTDKYDTEILSVVRTICTSFNRIKKYKIKGQVLNIPNNPEEYLAERYGNNWRIPDRNYIYWKAPSTYPINNKGFFYKL